MSSVSYSLEHFYFGQLVHHGKAVGEPRLLAKSPGVTDEQIEGAVQSVPLPPLPGVPNGAWAVTRGRNITPLMVQAEQGAAGQLMRHYIITPPEVLRALSGNLRAMQTLIEAQLPVYETLGDALSPLELLDSGANTTDEQIDNILDLMTFTKNNMKTLTALLSAIVQGVQLVVRGAPAELAPRVKFIEGLLALLPPSTRFGVTFATHTLGDMQLDVQIRFVEGEGKLTSTVIYDWKVGKISGEIVDDEYSQFIISQLRLDAELVVQRTQALTAVAGWRVRQGDRLAGALGYASHRTKLDDALLSNQPVDLGDVAQILREDPTLTAELRLAYGRHLLNFSLAMNEMEQTDALLPLLPENPELAQLAYQQFSSALDENSAWIIYDTLARWTASANGPQEEKWLTLTRRAANLALDGMIADQDIDDINDFLDAIQGGPAVQALIPAFVEKLLPLAPADPALAEKLFALALLHLEAEPLERLLASPTFLGQIPKPLAGLVAYLTGRIDNVPPAGFLMRATATFAEQQPFIVLRMAELAVTHGRLAALDASALEQLLKIALAPTGRSQAVVLLAVVRGYHSEALSALERPGPRYLLQILLALGQYDELAGEMIRHARVLYPGDLQPNYIQMTQRLFAETPLTPEEAAAAIAGIEAEGIKAVPLVVASTGALEASGWSPVMDSIAATTTETLLQNPRYLEVLNPEAIVSLLTFHVQRENVTDAIRTAGMVPIVAAHQETGGMMIISQMYTLMTGDERIRLAGMELLRRYVRETDDQSARQAVIYFSRDLGAEVRRALETTYTFKRMMRNVSILDYAKLLHIAAGFLQDTAAAYVEKNNIPTTGSLRSSLDAMPGSIHPDERREAVEHLMVLSKAIVALGRQFRANSGRDLERHIEQVLTASSDPLNALDILRMMGGYFAKGKRFTVKVEPVANPIGDRSVTVLKKSIEITRDVLGTAVQAFPPDKPVKLSVKDLREELDSLWGDIPTDQQREVVRGLAVDTQRIAELVALIEANGDPRALDEGGSGQKLETGRQRPKSTLEFYRYLVGYFKALR